MGQLVYRGNLSAKVFPFVSEYFGRTVIVQGQDQNFNRQLTANEDADKDRGIPQIYYCHNVMPTAEGFQSVGYIQEVATNVSTNAFENIFLIRDEAGIQYYFSHNLDNTNWILPVGANAWIQVSTIPESAGNTLITTGTINGQSYIYFSYIGCYLYDAGTQSLIPIVLDGLVATEIIGITSSAGYMIAWGPNSIAWSSIIPHTVVTDPIDFIPSLVTGAGGGAVEIATATLTICVRHYLGFIIYTGNEAIASVYSGNANYPFNLRAIINSGGLTDQALVSNDQGTGNHYSYTTSGMQLVGVSDTKVVFPDLTDFLAGGFFEDFDEPTMTFVTTILTLPMKKAINTIANRYLVVSYGISRLTHAVVFDLVQKRFGKLKRNHVCSFEFKELIPESVDSPRTSIGLLQSDGSVYTVDFKYASASSTGVMLLGKFQYLRTRLLQLQEVDLENIRVGNNFNLYNFNSVDGKTFASKTVGYLKSSNQTQRTYSFHDTGINHTLAMVGNFSAVSNVMKFNIQGRR